MGRWTIIGAIFLVILSVSLFFSKGLTVESGINENGGEVIVLKNKTWYLSFSEKLDKESVNNETIYVTDERGEKVDTKIVVNRDGKTVMILPPENGYNSNSSQYTLHVKGNIHSKYGKKLNKDKKIPFIVKEELPTMSSKNKLIHYFKNILAKEEKFFKNERLLIQEDKASSGMENKLAAETAMGANMSETNIQVQGVDEGDIVKTNGEHIFKITDRNVYIIKVNGGNIELDAVIRYDDHFYPIELFLHGDRLVVIGEEMRENKEKEILRMDYGTKGMVYQISNPKKPVEERSVVLEGQFVSTRKMDEYVYIVTNQYPNYWLLKEDIPVELRPKFFDSSQGNQYKFIDYDKIYYFPESEEPNYTIIGAFDLNDPTKEMTITTYLGSGDLMYMSKENIYLAVQNWGIMPFFVNGRNFSSVPTTIYKFSVDGLKINFHSSVEFEGKILNQFSMDEYNGYFRVAVTKGQAWNEEEPSSNHLFIFDENLKLISSLDDLAKGERIYSARFMGEKIYLVTFKETDPLFVIDGKDPKNPKVLGELKIPGFSNYLHPIDENHLVGFGYDTKVVTMGESKEPIILTDGVKLSLFDVSVLTNPKEKFTEIIGGRGTFSPLNYDHKALLYYPQKQIFAFPIHVYESVEGNMYESKFKFQGAYVYHIDVDNGFQLKTKITHLDSSSLYEEWMYEIQRLVYINETIYALSPKKVTAITIDGYETIGELLLEKNG